MYLWTRYDGVCLESQLPEKMSQRDFLSPEVQVQSGQKVRLHLNVCVCGVYVRTLVIIQ